MCICVQCDFVCTFVHVCPVMSVCACAWVCALSVHMCVWFYVFMCVFVHMYLCLACLCMCFLFDCFAFSLLRNSMIVAYHGGVQEAKEMIKIYCLKCLNIKHQLVELQKSCGVGGGKIVGASGINYTTRNPTGLANRAHRD